MGYRETTDGNFAVETHILNRDINQLDESIEVDIEFYSFLRENRKFDSIGDLKSQIEIDILEANRYFK